jgi:hypothetical protein
MSHSVLLSSYFLSQRILLVEKEFLGFREILQTLDRIINLVHQIQINLEKADVIVDLLRGVAICPPSKNSQIFTCPNPQFVIIIFIVSFQVV